MRDNTNKPITDVNEVVTIRGKDSDGRKLKEKCEQKITKLEAFSRLKDYKNPPNYDETSKCLECIFGLWQEKPLHWYYVAEYYTLKSINSAFNGIKKRNQNGGMPIENLGAYFYTILDRYHPKRKIRKRKIFGETRRDKIKREKMLVDQLNKKPDSTLTKDVEPIVIRRDY